MNVIYTFRPDSWKVFPPYIHHYEEKQTTKSFVMRSRIFIYEYVIDQVFPDHFIDWMQFVFYDETGKELDDTNEMIEKVIVHVKDPEYTISYPHLEILQKKNIWTCDEDGDIRDMDCVYYWASALNQEMPLLLHGVSYKNGKMKEHVMLVHDIDLEQSLAEDGYGIDHSIRLTEQCKRRISYMMRWLSEK